MAQQLYRIALDCTGAPNKVDSEFIFTLKSVYVDRMPIFEIWSCTTSNFTTSKTWYQVISKCPILKNFIQVAQIPINWSTDQAKK